MNCLYNCQQLLGVPKNNSIRQALYKHSERVHKVMQTYRSPSVPQNTTENAINYRKVTRFYNK